MSGLADRHAYPDGVAQRLPDEEIRRLLPEIPGWEVVDGTLTRDVTVKNFAAALEMVNAIGRIAEDENHHPDLTIHRWNHVRVTFYTHTAGGITENDMILAAKVSGVMER